MDPFGKFVAELVEHETMSDAGSAAGLQRPIMAASETRLLQQLRDEILQTGVLIAVSAGIANALERRTPKVSRHSLQVYAPFEIALHPNHA